jgi:hypothetical protein
MKKIKKYYVNRNIVIKFQLRIMKKYLIIQYYIKNNVNVYNFY